MKTSCYKKCLSSCFAPNGFLQRTGKLLSGGALNGIMLDESVGNGLRAVPPNLWYLHGAMNGIPSIHIPFNRVFQPVGL